VEAFPCRVEPLVVSSESAETGGPGEASFDDPASWQQDEAAFREGVLDDFESDAVVLSCGCGVLSGVALIDVGQLDRIASHLLYLLSQCFHLGAVALVDRGHSQRKQVAQRIDRDVHLGPLAALGSVVPGAGTRFGRGLQRPAVEADRCPANPASRLSLPPTHGLQGFASGPERWSSVLCLQNRDAQKVRWR
jgi:hypothetical protein